MIEIVAYFFLSYYLVINNFWKYLDMMMIREPYVQSFLDSLKDVILSQSDAFPSEMGHALEVLSKTKKQGIISQYCREDSAFVSYTFKKALRYARKEMSQMQVLCDSLSELYSRLSWHQRTESSSHEFSNGHANSQILGPLGIECREDITIGLTLMAPNIIYPEHKHSPEEVYLVMSSGYWQQAGGDWFSPGVGGLVYNKSYIKHSMSSEKLPLLAIWLLNGSIGGRKE